MNQFADVSEWYTQERVEAEEAIWAKGQHYIENAGRIGVICDQYLLRTVAEFGCGTGWIPTVLARDLDYLVGIDGNEHMLALARAKSPAKFIRCDLRNLDHLVPQADLVCSFAVLKHFSFADWPGILKGILARGRYGLFNQHALPDDRTSFDAGSEWHSIWPRKCDVIAAVKAAGHEVIHWDESHIDPGVGAPEAYVTTRRLG